MSSAAALCPAKDIKCKSESNGFRSNDFEVNVINGNLMVQ